MKVRQLRFWPLWLLSFALAGSSNASLSPETNKLFAENMELAIQGKLVDYRKIKALDAIYRQSPESDERVFAAYLLTYAPASLLSESKSKLIDFLLNMESEPVIGQQAVARLFRLRADQRYDAGDFVAAVLDYEEIRKRDAGQLAHYALLKIGWSYLNTKQPARAFDLWMGEASANRPAVELTLALYQGLGQAIVEDMERKPESIARLNSLKLSSPQKDAVIRGILEGIATLKSTDDHRRLAADLSGLSLWNELVRTLFEKNVSGKEACLRLVWLNAKPSSGPYPFQPFATPAQACLEWMRHTSEKGHADVSGIVEAGLSRIEMKASQRSVRFNFYHTQNQSVPACSEGVLWLFEENDATKRQQIPATPILQHCRKQDPMSPTLPVTDFMERLRRQALESQQLGNPSDPLIYFLAGSLEGTFFRKSLTDELARAGRCYHSTIVPTLLSEALVKRGSFCEAHSVLKNFPETHGSDDKGLWFTATDPCARQKMEVGDFAGAHDIVSQSFPPGGAHLSAGQLRLWTHLIQQAQARGEKSEWLAAALRSLLTRENLALAPELAAPLFRLSILLEDWQAAWLNITDPQPKYRLPKDLRQAILLELFLRIADGRFTPAEVSGPSLDELSFLRTIALAAREKRYGDLCHAKTVGDTAMSKDQRFLAKLSAESEQKLDRLERARDVIAKVHLWLSFLGPKKRQIDRREWSSPQLLDGARKILGEFCERAYPNIVNAGPDTRMTPDQWAAVRAQLEKQHTQCATIAKVTL